MTMLPIRQSLAADALQQVVSALAVRDAEGRAVVIAKVELGNVARKMLLANVMKRADQAALEDREETFDGIRSDAVARILAGTMVQRFMLVEHAMKGAIDRAFICVHGRRRRNILAQNIAHSAASDGMELEATRFPAAFDQRDDLHLVMRAAPASGGIHRLRVSGRLLRPPLGFDLCNGPGVA